MSERFTKLFTAPENLYAATSPVIITAGALLKDNQTGKVLAQLKMRNIGAKTIKAATVLIHSFDTVGDPLGGELTYQYLDLAAAQGQDFGAKTPIPLADATARSFSATVKEIIFADNTTWTAADELWEPLSAPVTLEKSLNDAELVKQYRIQYGADCNYMPIAQRDLWRCTCGEWSRRGTDTCCHCGKSLPALMAVDLTALRAERDARLATEAETAAEKKAASTARMKKAKKAAVIVAALLAVGVAAYFAVTKVIIPNGKYNDAVALMEVGQYEEAITAFEAMDGYKDSAEQILECKYLAAEALLEEGDTAQAAKYFAAIDWRDSVARSKELWNELIYQSSISTGTWHTVGLKTDGTVVAVGRNNWGQLDVDDWTGIVAVDAGFTYTVGLKSDGTLVATGNNTYGQLEVADWTDIIEVAVNGGTGHTVGLKADGTVVATGYNEDGQCSLMQFVVFSRTISRGFFVEGLGDGQSVLFHISGDVLHGKSFLVPSGTVALIWRPDLYFLESFVSSLAF